MRLIITSQIHLQQPAVPGLLATVWTVPSVLFWWLSTLGGLQHEQCYGHTKQISKWCCWWSLHRAMATLFSTGITFLTVESVIIIKPPTEFWFIFIWWTGFIWHCLFFYRTFSLPLPSCSTHLFAFPSQHFWTFQLFFKFMEVLWWCYYFNFFLFLVEVEGVP